MSSVCCRVIWPVFYFGFLFIANERSDWSRGHPLFFIIALMHVLDRVETQGFPETTGALRRGQLRGS